MDKKPWWQSRGVWGSIIAMAGFILPMFGLEWTPTDATEASNLVEQIMVLGGTALAFYGRIAAKKSVGLSGD